VATWIIDIILTETLFHHMHWCHTLQDSKAINHW